MTSCSSLKSACLPGRHSLSAEDVSRQPAECIEWIKGGRTAPVATKLHQCAYLTPGRRMRKRRQKLFSLLSPALLMLFFFLGCCIFSHESLKKKKLPPGRLCNRRPLLHRSSSLISLAVWMPAVFVMTRVQSGGKLEPRRTGNWQIVFCPARIIISNTQRLRTQRTSAAKRRYQRAQGYVVHHDERRQRLHSSVGYAA